MKRKLPLPDGQRTKVFRFIVNWLQNDPVLSRVIRQDAWQDFSGNPGDPGPQSPLQAPTIRLSPAPAPMGWTSVESMISPLYINIECLIAGVHADDILNLQEAIENAIYPVDGTAQAKIQQTLQSPPYECMTGLIEFTLPLWDRNADMGRTGNWYPIGQIRIDIRRTVAH